MPSNKVHRYLKNADGRKSSDSNSTGGLIRHAEKCWSSEVVAKAKAEGKKASDIRELRRQNNNVLTEESLTVYFERMGKGKVTYSTRAHTKHETR